MMNLYQDESGDFSFAETSRYTHGLITIMEVLSQQDESLKKTMRRQRKKLIKAGWNKHIEVKATSLFHNIRFGQQSVSDVIKAILRVPTIKIHYVVVNKPKLNNQSFKTASYGTAYNYFTGVLLSELMFQDNLYHMDYVYDIRNKEAHSKLRFTEYLKTKLFGKALEQNIDVKFSARGDYSHQNYSLAAVDFLTWGIFRQFEYKDSLFYNMMRKNFGRKREWYIEK